MSVEVVRQTYHLSVSVGCPVSESTVSTSPWLQTVWTAEAHRSLINLSPCWAMAGERHAWTKCPYFVRHPVDVTTEGWILGRWDDDHDDRIGTLMYDWPRATEVQVSDGSTVEDGYERTLAHTS